MSSRLRDLLVQALIGLGIALLLLAILALASGGGPGFVYEAF